MVNCQGCGEETTSSLCCPKCSEYGRTSFFCSQDCFVSSWPSHSKLHVIIRQAALSTTPSSEACSSQPLSGDDAVAMSPATTAASVSASGEESRLQKKNVAGVTDGVHSVETRPRSRIPSRAPSETELPVVSSSAASSSFSRTSAVAPSASSFSSREPPFLSSAGAASAGEGSSAKIAAFSGRREDEEEESTAIGVLNAVRSLLLPRTRDNTGQKTQTGRPAAAGAAVRVTQAVRSVLSTSHSRHSYAVPGGDRKKDAGAVVAGREAAGRSGAAASAAVAPPAGVGFCRCLTLALICLFCLTFMWMMRRILFDSVGSSSAYYSGHPDEVVPNRGEAMADSNDVVSAVLARIGARPYGEEISALQASLQDVRNELAAVTTLVQQHGVVIDQFIEKPNFSGRRQGGGGGAVNQAISAFLEGGPPLPDAPELKLRLVASAASVSDRKVAAGVGEALQQEAVASPHSAVHPGGTGAAGGGTAGVEAGVSSQKFYDANVTMEGDRAKKEARVQQPFRDSSPDQQLVESSGRQQASGQVVPGGPANSVADGKLSLSGSLGNAEVKSVLQLSGSASPPLHPSAPQENSAGPSPTTHTQGNAPQPPDPRLGLRRFAQRGSAVNLSAAQAGEARPAVAASIRAPAEESVPQEGPFGAESEGKDLRSSSRYRGQEEQRRSTTSKVIPSSGQHGALVRQAFRGNRSREEGPWVGERNDEGGKLGLSEMSETDQSPFFDSATLGSLEFGRHSSRGNRRAKRT